MTTDLGVLLPVRIETRFKNGDLWLRVVPDEPWFVRDDPRITPGELAALRRYVAAPAPAAGSAAGDAVPAAWRDLAAQVGAPRAAYLHRTFVTTAADGTRAVPDPAPGDQRDGPALPRIAGFPTELAVWSADASGLHQVLALTVQRSRLLADFADPDLPGDRRWWEDWDEAVAAGVAGVIPAASLTPPIDALYVTGLGDGDPGALFAAIAADGRLGLLAPGLPTNSVDGTPAAALATDAATWWRILTGTPGASDTDVSLALTGDPGRLGNSPGGDLAHRAGGSAMVTALWPALWGFAASQVFDLARGRAPASWAAAALFPEGAYPTVRVGPQPYGLMPVTAWTRWQADQGDPALEAPLVQALLVLRARLAASARARGTAAGKDTDGLLDLIADTPSSGRFRYRPAWPLELWWLASVSSGLPVAWREFAGRWPARYPLARQLGLIPLRRYGARGMSRGTGLPLVLPDGTGPAELPGLLGALADAALATPAGFANTASLEAGVLGGHGGSLLLRLAVRSLQVVIGDLSRERAGLLSFDPEPLARATRQPGRLQQLIAGAAPPDPAVPTELSAMLRDVAAALRALGSLPVPELERRLRATVDTSTHRIDPWLTAVPQRRLDALAQAGTLHRMLGAYGWVDAPAPGQPGPTQAGLLHTPSASSALAAAVLRDRAVSDPSPRWDLDVTSRSARAAARIAAEVRNGADLAEVLGREVERIVGRTQDIESLRQAYPVRSEHAGRRVCDGLQVLAQQPFPVTVGDAQAAALADLRAAIDSYGDLLVADAVHHLIEGRADVAGQVMDAAAGLSRPPELSVLRTARDGRGVSTSVVLAFPHVPAAPLPPAAADRALSSPAAALDPSAAAAIAAQTGGAADWDFVIGPAGQSVTVTLADLGLTPGDALALTRTRLERLAAAAGGNAGEVTGGSGGDRYERAAELAGLIGRNPASRRALSEDRAADPPGDPVDAELLARYVTARDIGTALAGELSAQVALLGDTGLGTADEAALRRILGACAAWGIAPDPPGLTGAGWLAAAARLALPQLSGRLTAAPAPDQAAQLSRAVFLDAACAMVSPTGQLGILSARPATDIPAVQPAAGLDSTWLTVAAAVRPSLARLEAHQLAAADPFTAWANRAADPWQANAQDSRPLVAVYAAPGLDLAAPGDVVAAAALDQFDEVIPAADQRTGAAFGFDAPASRAQQAILLAVPPAVGAPLDQATLAQILAETRELAHARMARPVDLDEQFWGLAPTCLLPAAGTIATPMEAGG
jgi:hypothetical protein